MGRNRGAQGGMLTPPQIATLKQANELIAAGKQGEAAPSLAGLAQAVQAANHPRRAAKLYARAAHAYADSRDGQAALAQARGALDLFLQCHMARRAALFYTNITRKLNDAGLGPAAARLQQEYGGRIGQLGPLPPERTAPQHGQLPTNCPKCGAPTPHEDASWIDENTVECDYCGTPIRATG